MRLAHCRAVPADSQDGVLGEPPALSPAEADVPAGALELRWRELARRTRARALTWEGAAEAERQVSSSEIFMSQKGLLQGCVQPFIPLQGVLQFHMQHTRAAVCLSCPCQS